MLKRFKVTKTLAKALKVALLVGVGIQTAIASLPDRSVGTELPVTVVIAAVAGGIEAARNAAKAPKSE